MSRIPHLLLLALVASAIGTAPPPPAAPDDPTRTILLFVADWCAPCRQEVARLPEITAAAAPWRVLVADADGSASPARLLRRVPAAQRWTPAPARWAAARRNLLADQPGLPFAVAFDAAARPCATTRRGLDAMRTRALIAACTAP